MSLARVFIPALLCVSVVAQASLSFAADDADGKILVAPRVPEKVVTSARRLWFPDSGVSTDVVSEERAREYESFVNALRWSMIPDREEVELSFLEFCREAAPTFSSLLDRASESVDFFEYDRANTILQQAGKALVCGNEAATSRSLARYYLLQGVVTVERDGKGDPLFEAALRVEPQMPTITDYSPRVMESFRRAKANTGVAPSEEVSLDVGDTGGLELRVNGLPVSANQLFLPVGQYYLQWVLPDGRGLVGRFVILQAERAGPPSWPPRSMRLPEKRKIEILIRRGVARGKLPPSLQSGLQNVMQTRALQWIVLVSPTADEHWFQTLRLHPNGLVESKRVEYKPPAGRSKIITYATTSILGGCALVTGGMYAQAYRELSSTEYPTAEDGQEVWRTGNTARIASLSCLTGSLISAGWGIIRGRRSHADRPDVDSLDDLSWRLEGAASKNYLGVQVGARW